MDAPFATAGYYSRCHVTGWGLFILSSSGPLKKEIGMRRTILLLFSTAVALLLASGAVLALPSERPDDTPMLDGRVRAIEQVGTNIWVGGRFSRVKNATARSWAAWPTWRSSTR